MKHLTVGTTSTAKNIKIPSFGDIMVVSIKKTIVETVVSDTSELAAIGVLPAEAVYKKVEQIFMQSPRPDTVRVVGVMPTGADWAAGELKTALDALYKPGLYYFVTIDEFDIVNGKEFFEWGAAKELLPYATSMNDTLADLTTFVDTCKVRGALFFTDKVDDFVGDKVVGWHCTGVPGKLGWARTTPINALNCEVVDAVKQELELLDINYMNEELMGVYQLFNGMCLSGEPIYIVWGIANINYDIYSQYTLNLAPPNDNYHPGLDPRGVQMLEQMAVDILEIYCSDSKKFIAKDSAGNGKYIVTVRTDYTTAEINSGYFEVFWEATPTGKAYTGTINGTLSMTQQ